MDRPKQLVRQSRSLDGEWLLELDPDNIGKAQGWGRDLKARGEPIQVPACWNRKHPGYEGVAWYFLKIEEPPLEAQQQILLKFWAVDYYAEVWVDGHFVGGHEGGHTPFVLDASAAWSSGGQHLIAVRVVDPPAGEPRGVDGFVLAEIPSGSQSGHFNYGGIWQSVELIRTDGVFISALQVEPLSEPDRVRVSFELLSVGLPRCRIRFDLMDQDRRYLESVSSVVPSTRGTTRDSIRLRLGAGRAWSPEYVGLYILRATVGQGMLASDVMELRFGARDVRFDARLSIGGKRRFVKAVADAQFYPFDLAAPADRFAYLKQLKFIRFMGFNAVRFSGRPPLPLYLDLCDDLGLMTIVDAASASMAESPKLLERCSNELIETVVRDRHHASLICWGIAGQDAQHGAGRLRAELAKCARILDKEHPVLDVLPMPEPGRSAEGATGALAEYRAALPCPTSDAQVERLRRLEGPGVPFIVGGLRAAGLPDFPTVLRDIGPDVAECEDVAQFVRVGAWFTRVFERSGLSRVFGTLSDLAVETQKVAGHALARWILALRANPRCAGLVVEQIADISGEDFCGLRDACMNLKATSKYVRRALEPLTVALFPAASSVFEGEPLRLEVVALNDEGRTGQVPLTLLLVDRLGAELRSVRRDVVLTGEPVQTVWNEPLELPPGLTGFLRVKARLNDEASDGEFILVLPPPRRAVRADILDPEGVLGGAIERSGPGQGYVVAPIRSLEAFNAVAGPVVEAVRGGARAALLGLPLDEGAEDPPGCRCVRRRWGSAAIPARADFIAADPSVGPVFRVVHDHPVFSNLPVRCVADWVYADVVSRRAVRVEGAQALVTTIRPPMSTHAKTAGCRAASEGQCAADLAVLRLGKGELLISALELGPAGAGAVAQTILYNLARYVGGGE